LSVERDRQRYTDALHAVQTGIKTEMELGQSRDLEPKHLRVGINSALVDSAAIAHLLMAKGVISEAEYYEALAEEAEREQARYEARLSAALGHEVHLA
jgi:hypothetical protein